jgi:hypothetical protein
MANAFEYLLMGCGLSFVIAAVRIFASILRLPVPDWLDRTMLGVASAPLVGLIGFIGVALIMRVGS